MSLNKIHLSNRTVAAVYKNQLILKGNATTHKHNEETATIPALGKNTKKLLIIIKSSKLAFLEEASMSLLIKMLDACGFTLADCALVNAENKNVVYDKLIGQFDPECILFFGVQPASIETPLSFPLYQLQKYHSLTLLYMPSLAEIETSKEAKQQVWSALKKMFAG